MDRRHARTWLVWVALACPACSLLIRNDVEQCATDADCNERGLSGAVCVLNVCKRQTVAAISGSAGSQPAASPPVVSTPPVSSVAVAVGGSAGAAPAAEAGARASGAVSIPALAGAGGSRSAAGSRAGSGAGSPAAGSSAPCTGASCPQCSVDADCERLGMPNATCANALCWAATPQCSKDDECVARGPEFTGGKCLAMQCLPNPRWRCEAESVNAMTTSDKRMLKLLVRDSLSLNPVTNLHVVACQKLDLTCTQPIADATTGTDGYLSITLPANFAGYLQQSERREYSPAMYFLPAVFPEDGVLQPFPLLGSGVIIDALAAALGGTIDPRRGNMMLIAEDCMGMPLAGVTFSSPQKDAQTVQFYVRDLLPSTTATDTAEIGNGGFLNFPAGTAVINLKHTTMMLDLATVSIVVRAGYISVAYIRPHSR